MRHWRYPAFALLIVLHGCNPFRTGTPEQPGGQLINYPQPTTTDNVLRILALSLGAKDNRAYLERLASDFAFSPDPVQRQSDNFRNFPAAWGYEHEEIFLAGLFSNADSIAVEWHNVLTQPQGEGATVTAFYDLTIWSQAQPETHYRGRAEFSMVQVAGIWNIRTWNDVVEGEYTTTWGLLRARLLATG